MSNRANIVRTTFENLDGSKTYGYRIWDDYAHDYTNYEDTDIFDMDAIEFLTHVASTMEGTLNEEGRGIIEFVIEQKQGIEIDNAWYGWEEIQEALTGNVTLIPVKNDEVTIFPVQD